jgi:2-oxoglutarate-Fe(II)-dependent oxygenase superfamily protein
MGDPMQRLAKVLAPLGESCEFVAWGTLTPVLPGLEVEGAGPIGLPVSDEEARRLIGVADQAPYGRGTETIVDTDVRRVWQIEPSRFVLRNPGWEAQVEEIVTAVRQRFAIDAKVRHELYKLLVYETGSFFAPHRDTEKTPGMFATLVVCLPSRHEGGTLVVEHEGECTQIEFGGPDSEFQTAYAAFYADCRHEITPVRSGYRVCLVYNLALDRAAPAPSTRRPARRVPPGTRGTRHPQPSAPRKAPAVAEAESVLRELFADPSLDLNKAVIPLEHQYTEAGLHPAALKGADRPRAEVLARAAASLDYECSLALVTHYQMGSVDLETWTPPYLRSRRSRHSYRRAYYEDEPEADYDDEGAEMEEVFEDSITLDHWLDMNGEERPFGTLHVEEDELLCRGDRTDWAVHQEIQEATGNEGAELQRWYRRCAIVLWPRDRTFRILAAEGPAVALPVLERMAASATDPEALSACRTFAGEILNHWTRSLGYGEREDGSGRMLALLEQIGTVELARQFVREVLPLDFTGREGASICRLCERFGWEALRPALASFLERQQPAPYDVAPVRLLSLVAPLYEEPSTWTAERQAVCASLAHDLDRILQRWGSQPAPVYLLDHQPRAGLVANAVRVFALGSAPEALDRFLDRALRGELGCGLREVLAPDLKAIAGWLPEAPAARAAYARLRQHCLSQLRAATSEPVEPPADWRRDAELDCRCQDCQALSRFLADPEAPVARFPLAQERRRHLHQQIERHQCDCTHETERKGRPYTLVCKKTRASYERLERQYQQDRRLLEDIELLPDLRQV